MHRWPLCSVRPCCRVLEHETQNTHLTVLNATRHLGSVGQGTRFGTRGGGPRGGHAPYCRVDNLLLVWFFPRVDQELVRYRVQVYSIALRGDSSSNRNEEARVEDSKDAQIEDNPWCFERRLQRAFIALYQVACSVRKKNRMEFICRIEQLTSNHG